MMSELERPTRSSRNQYPLHLTSFLDSTALRSRKEARGPQRTYADDREGGNGLMQSILEGVVDPNPRGHGSAGEYGSLQMCKTLISSQSELQLKYSMELASPSITAPARP